MFDSPSFGDSETATPKGIDTELQEFLLIEKQKAQLTAQVNNNN